MPKFFMYRNRIFMKVYPVSALLRSKTLGEAFDKGNIFGVDMNSGAFTILKRGADEEIPLDHMRDPDGFRDFHEGRFR